ncbi:MAG: hypothetical protein A3I79_07205 [Gemmatimonadetes bacterium RIFCSPLOWO2_02_FULL_71_11]|nr:MAG: hypothetical protein A3I79_07205 [Gemmatimonadetes bacterium RIFCSPLOWO2_02_FULL_71_11]
MHVKKGWLAQLSRALNPVQIRRLLARTLRLALDGGPAAAQLVDRWAAAEAPDDSWIAAITWDGIGAAVGWALATLDLRHVAPPALDIVAADAFEEARQQSVQLSADLLRLGAEFEAMGIPAIALKGSALLAANVAPALGIRWMSDIDILVPESQVEQAAWILESLEYMRGYARDPRGPEVFRPYHETFTSPDGRVVELHWRLGPSRWGRAAAANEWFARAQPGAMAGLLVPATADLFWHFLLHDARNHAWSSGSLRAALDLTLCARATDFTLAEVTARLREDPRPEPLLEAIADAASLSPALAAEVEPSPQPRYLRLARWRASLGRRPWRTERIAESIAWGASLDRARRFGGWGPLIERTLRVIPEAEPGTGVFAMMRRAFLNLRHAAFVGVLAASHFLSVPVKPEETRRRLPRPSA